VKLQLPLRQASRTSSCIFPFKEYGGIRRY